MKNNEEKKLLQNNGEYFVIHKETVVNYFFVSILVLALGTFLALFVMGAIKMVMSEKNPETINPDLIGYYTDEFLNMSYPVPNSDTWTGVQIDTTEISSVTDASKGEDDYFSIDDDALTAEVISFLTFNQDEDAGFREFMSFTFAPAPDYTDETFTSYCESKFKKEMSEAAELESYTLTNTTIDEYGGVIMDMTVVQKVEKENEDGTKTETEATTYYVQYAKKIGKNIGYITYGSVIDDETVKPYLQFFLNNIITEKSSIQ